MKFAIINDIHFGTTGGDYKGVQRKLISKSHQLVEQFIRKMNEVEKPSFVVNLGDTIEDVNDREKDIVELHNAIKILTGLKMPIYHLIGNHDVKTISEEDIAKILGYKKTYYSFDSGDYHFVALSFERDMDEHSPTYRIFFMPREQLKWLKSDLLKTDKQTVVFGHHGLADDDMKGNFWFEDQPEQAVLGNNGEVRKILEDSGKVKAVFTAHQHWNRMFVHNGIPYFTVTSLVENFNNDGVASEAHTIVDLTDRKIVVNVQGKDPANYEFEFASS